MSEELNSGLHPDTDALNAFIEGALPEHERAGCLTHLADCAHCREVVFLARAAAEIEEPAAVKEAAVPFWKKLLRPMPAVAAAATAIVMVFSIGLYRTIRPAEPRAQITATAKPPVEPAPEPTPEPTTVQPTPEPHPAASRRTAVQRAPRQQEQAPVVLEPPPPPPPPPPAAPPPPPAAVARLSADPEAAGITGTITDSTGAAIPKAQVELKNQNTGATYSSTSDPRGQFSLSGLLPGRYDLSVSSMGFRKFVEPSINLEPQTIARVDSRLEVGASTESVTVNAEATLLKTESGAVTRSAGSTSAAELPLNGRSFPALIAIAGPAYILPDRSNPVSFAVKDRLVVAVDSAGALFRSEDGGKSWKRVKGKWKGRIVRVAVSAKAAFELTTEPASTWLSADGRHWSPAPASR
jgi:hypothetical protein